MFKVILVNSLKFMDQQTKNNCSLLCKRSNNVVQSLNEKIIHQKQQLEENLYSKLIEYQKTLGTIKIKLYKYIGDTKSIIIKLNQNRIQITSHIPNDFVGIVYIQFRCLLIKKFKEKYFIPIQIGTKVLSPYWTQRIHILHHIPETHSLVMHFYSDVTLVVDLETLATKWYEQQQIIYHRLSRLCYDCQLHFNHITEFQKLMPLDTKYDLIRRDSKKIAHYYQSKESSSYFNNIRIESMNLETKIVKTIVCLRFEGPIRKCLVHEERFLLIGVWFLSKLRQYFFVDLCGVNGYYLFKKGESLGIIQKIDKIDKDSIKVTMKRSKRTVVFELIKCASLTFQLPH